MKCHQILTGACNPGDKTFGVGSVEGKRMVYCSQVILKNLFQSLDIKGFTDRK